MAVGRRSAKHRTDRLSAAYRNLATEEDEAEGYKAFCHHYGMEPTRNNAGIAHENGSVEASHGHLKRTLEEALDAAGLARFRRSRRYQAFLAETIARKNAPRRQELAVELAAMGPLPRNRRPISPWSPSIVTRSGTISVRGVLYTVPSRLVGCRLKVHVYDDRLVCYLGTTPVLTAERRYYRATGPASGSSTTATWSDRWSRSRRPSGFRYSAKRCSRARCFVAPGRRSTSSSIRARHAGSMSDCCISPQCRLARRGSPNTLKRAGRGGMPDIETARAAVAPVPAQMPTVTVMSRDPRRLRRLDARTGEAPPRLPRSTPPSCRSC